MSVSVEKAVLTEAVQLLETVMVICERSIPVELLSDMRTFLTRSEIRPLRAYEIVESPCERGIGEIAE